MGVYTNRLDQVRHKVREELAKRHREVRRLPYIAQLAEPEPRWITDDQWKGAAINEDKFAKNDVAPMPVLKPLSARDLASKGIERLDAKDYSNTRRFLEEIVDNFD